MANYEELSEAFKRKQAYKYDKTLRCDGTKIIKDSTEWEYCTVQAKWILKPTKNVVIAEWINHKGKEYAVVYNRSNKCYATEGLLWTGESYWYRQYNKNVNLKYGELGKPPKDQQVGYKSQLMDRLIYKGAVTHILIPTSLNGDSAFFKDL